MKIKLRAHAARTLWLVRRPEAPGTLGAVLRDGLKKFEIKIVY